MLATVETPQGLRKGHSKARREVVFNAGEMQKDG